MSFTFRSRFTKRDLLELKENEVKLGRWHDGNENPKETGWYLRDYRNPPKETKGEIPPFSVDHFIKDEHGAFWYVLDTDKNILVLNDAWFECLPWCKIKGE